MPRVRPTPYSRKRKPTRKLRGIKPGSTRAKGRPCKISRFFRNIETGEIRLFVVGDMIKKGFRAIDINPYDQNIIIYSSGGGIFAALRKVPLPKGAKVMAPEAVMELLRRPKERRGFHQNLKTGEIRFFKAGEIKPGDFERIDINSKDITICSYKRGIFAVQRGSPLPKGATEIRPEEVMRLLRPLNRKQGK